MYFRVRLHARRAPDHAETNERGEPIPAGMFTTRYASGRDEATAAERASMALKEEIASQDIWNALTVEVEQMERCSLLDYALNHRKGGGSWYLRES
jgi:hypothetical protein